MVKENGSLNLTEEDVSPLSRWRAESNVYGKLGTKDAKFIHKSKNGENASAGFAWFLKALDMPDLDIPTMQYVNK